MNAPVPTCLSIPHSPPSRAPQDSRALRRGLAKACRTCSQADKRRRAHSVLRISVVSFLDAGASSIEGSWMGCLCHRTDPQEHAHHSLRGREDHPQGESETRGEVSEDWTHLVLHTEQPLGDRRRRRRQHRPVHQSRLPAELLGRSERRDDLDSRGEDDPQGRGTQLQLPHHRRCEDPVQVPS